MLPGSVGGDRPDAAPPSGAVRVVVAGALLLLAAVSPARPSAAAPAPRWVGIWAGVPSDSAGGAFTDQTLRLVVTPLGAASRLRVRLSNRFGTRPITFDRVCIGKQASGASLVRGSNRPVTFGGAQAVTIAAGDDALSDPVRFAVRALDHLTVSVYVAGMTGPATEHFQAAQTSFATPAGSGDHTDEDPGDAYAGSSTARAFLTGIDAAATERTRAVVTFGDSITDGYQGPIEHPGGIDADARYPDFLARRLRRHPGPRRTVLNAGIGGNRILRDGTEFLIYFGPRALARLFDDAIAQAGVTDVIVLEGINDLTLPPAASAQEVIDGLTMLVARLKEPRSDGRRLNVLLGTLLPASGSLFGGASVETARQAVNHFIRTGGLADGVVDFDRVMRDPADPSRLRPELDSGDHEHPNSAGYREMARAVPLRALVGLRTADTEGH